MRNWLFPANIIQAKAIQKEMAERVVLEDRFENPKHIMGMDVSNTPFDPQQMIFSAAVILSYPSLTPIETAMQADKQTFPYITGLLAFREAPILTKAFRQLSSRVDLIMVDGHGVSHPRRLGIASHLGLLLDLPTIGVAKSLLVGSAEEPLGEEVGSMVPVLWKGKEIAMMLRTKKRCNPLIISAGHKITLITAVHLVLSCLKGYRLPEPTRRAHEAANRCRKNYAFSFCNKNKTNL